MMHTTIQTVSGSMISLTEPENNSYVIQDIAHALSQLCRFNGHSKPFYSVAQHSVNLSYRVAPSAALEALLHDAAEAYLGDMTSPLKAMMPEYRAIEERFDAAIRKAFKLPPEMDPEIKLADLRLLVTEQRDLMPELSEEWAITAGLEPFRDQIIPMFSYESFRLFMDRFKEIAE